MSDGTITHRLDTTNNIGKLEMEGMLDITLYISPDDGRPVIEIDTKPGLGEVRVYVNDGQVFAKDPEVLDAPASVMVTGNAIEGLGFVGPFPNHDAALEYAEADQYEEYLITAMTAPEARGAREV